MDEAGGLIRFSTKAIRASGGEAPSVEEVYGSMTRMNIASATEAPLDVDMTLRLLPNIAIANISSSPYRIERTQAQAADGNDDFVFTIARRADISIQQPGRGAEFGSGEAFLCLNDERQLGVTQQGARFLNIAVARDLVAPAISDIDAALKGRLPASMPLRLLASYADALTADADLTPEMAAMAASHMRDLVIATLGAKSADGQDARGVRAARLAAIKRDIKQNLGDLALSLNSVATRHGISSHYVRALFNMERTAFTDYVREQRLVKAFKLLSGPAGVQFSISSIAHGCGFGDLSWFNQAFKRRFGKTPSDVRHEARHHFAGGEGM